MTSAKGTVRCGPWAELLEPPAARRKRTCGPGPGPERGASSAHTRGGAGGGLWLLYHMPQASLSPEKSKVLNSFALKFKSSLSSNLAETPRTRALLAPHGRLSDRASALCSTARPSPGDLAWTLLPQQPLPDTLWGRPRGGSENRGNGGWTPDLRELSAQPNRWPRACCPHALLVGVFFLGFHASTSSSLRGPSRARGRSGAGNVAATCARWKEKSVLLQNELRVGRCPAVSVQPKYTFRLMAILYILNYFTIF